MGDNNDDKNPNAVKNATVQGAVVPPAAAVIITGLAAEMKRRWDIPLELSAGLIGVILAPLSALYTRWLAKLDTQ